MKALDFVTLEERDDPNATWYAVDPDVVYPAALEYAQSLLEDGASVPMYLQQHVAGLRAADLSDSAWDNALEPSEGLTAKRREDRATVLEAARLIFTALLREQSGGPVGVHILANDRWRL